MLLPSFLENMDLQHVVLMYFKDKFGKDFNGNDVFDTKDMFCQNPESLRYYFRHAPAFAESQLLQLIGFGNPKNPFALLFQLPKYLKLKKDKKRKKEIRSNRNIFLYRSIRCSNKFRKLLSEYRCFKFKFQWYPNQSQYLAGFFESYQHDVNTMQYTCINKISSCTISGCLTALFDVVTFYSCYFEKLEMVNSKQVVAFWIHFLRRTMPWNSIVTLGNVLVCYMLDNLHPFLKKNWKSFIHWNWMIWSNIITKMKIFRRFGNVGEHCGLMPSRSAM